MKISDIKKDSMKMWKEAIVAWRDETDEEKKKEKEEIAIMRYKYAQKLHAV
jgi:hypothetical protein